jgi:YD repeat-containing protein
LTVVPPGSTRTDYNYDPLNRMVSQTTGTTTSSHAYLGLTPDLTSETRPRRQRQRHRPDHRHHPQTIFSYDRDRLMGGCRW